MVEIDDAGSGSLIGGTCIGFFRRETKEYFYDFIPIHLYRPQPFKQKKYIHYVVDIAKKNFNLLDTRKDEPIRVCRGYIFDSLRKWLEKENYMWENTKITGDLQQLVEKTFEEHIISLGLPYDYIRYTKYPFHFHRLLKWVYADYDRRKKMCKTGWKSWQKYGSLKIDYSYGYLKNSSKICLKCGKSIQKGSCIKILRFTSNRPHILYLHDTC